MNFEQFNGLVQRRFKEMCTTGKLFKSSLNGDALWKLYLSGFTPDENPIFRDPSSSTMNGNNDKNFIRRYGSIVAVDENFEVMSLFDG